MSDGRSSPARGTETSGVANASLGFYTVWIAHLGRRYGILHALSRRNQPMGARALARASGLHEPAVRAWCEAGVRLRLIEGTRDRYRLASDQRILLADENDVRFLGGQFSYLALRSLDFEAFDAFFRRGVAPASATRHLREASEEATRWDHTSFLKFLLPRVPRLTSRLLAGARALDMGCGTGGWSIRMSREFPKSSFIGIDPDRTAIRIAAGKNDRTTDRVRFLVGDGGESMRDIGPLDLAYLGEVLYGVRDKPRLLRNVRRSLAPDGVLVVAEGLIGSPRKARDGGPRLVAAMGLDFALQGAHFFEKSELEALLRESGFDRLRFHDAGGGLWFVVANVNPKRG